MIEARRDARRRQPLGKGLDQPRRVHLGAFGRVQQRAGLGGKIAVGRAQPA
jgi:hypothetical protein